MGEEREEQLQKAFNFCIEELQKEEPQIYDTLQYLKCKNDHERLGIIVLRVLHLELSRTRSDANTSDAARIRLEWWKSAINEIINEKINISTYERINAIIDCIKSCTKEI